MLEKVRTWIDKHKMLLAGDTIIIACSGGPDSLALLHILARLRLEYSVGLVVAHVDHMLRGKESALEADFVVNFCRERSITCYQKAIDVPRFIEETGISAEEAARILRYQYLRQVAQEVGGAKIATGHHQDDQGETVLMNLLRGAGSAGIRGIQPVNGDIIRPFLGVSRAEIIAYCEAEGLEPRFDSSNENLNYLRNRIRIRLLPELEKKYNSSVKEALGRTAMIVGDEHDFIQKSAKDVWSQVVTEGTEGIFIATEPMRSLHIAIKREIFRMSIEKKQGSVRGITFCHVETLIEMLFSGRVGSTLQLPGGLVVRKGYDGLYIGAKPLSFKRKVESSGQELIVPGSNLITTLGIEITAKLTDTFVKEKTNMAVFDADELSFPLFVRTRHDGDRFQPIGFAGSKKLKDFLIDLKVPREMRDAIPIICDQKSIIWVGGYRQSQNGKSKETTKKFLILTIIENAIKE